MAVKTYRALRTGYVDGRVIEEGEVFTTEFKELVREDPDPENPKAVRPIKRDTNAVAITKEGKCPSWAVELGKDGQAALNADVAASDRFPDPDFEAMDKAALQAYAAERNVPFQANTNKADLITAIKAAASYTV